MASPDLVPLTPRAAAELEAATSPVDLLRRLLRPGGPVAAAVRAAGADPLALLERLPAEGEPASCEHVRNCASREAVLLGHRRVDLVHLLLALLYRDVPVTSGFLDREGLGLYDLRAYLQAPAASRQARRLRSEPLPSLRGAVRVSPVFLVLVGAMAAAGGLLYAGPPAAPVGPLTVLFVVAGWVTSLCLHEFGHALAAYLGGDRSVLRAGYLTLNPLKYTHPVFSILMPVLFVLMGGIGLPGGAVYVDRRALRSRGWEAVVSAAGPLATLLFTVAIALPFRLGLADFDHLAFWSALALLTVVELGSLVLNLLPIPPLDGFGILSPLLSWEARMTAARMGNAGIFVLFVLLWRGPVAGVFWGAVGSLASHLHVSILLAELGRQQLSLLGHG